MQNNGSWHPQSPSKLGVLVGWSFSLISQGVMFQGLCVIGTNIIQLLPFVCILHALKLNKTYSHHNLEGKATIIPLVIITNLTSNDLVIEIMQSFIVHRFISFVHKWSCIENTYKTWINVMTNEMWIYEWMNCAAYVFVC